MKKKGSLALMMLVVLFLLSAGELQAATEGGSDQGEKTEELLADMTLEEKTAQLFVITPDALTGVMGTDRAGAVTEEQFFDYPVGGIVFFEENIVSREQILEMTASLGRISQERIGLSVFLALDEEGGSVTRIAGRGITETPRYDSMYAVGSDGDPEKAREAGASIADYLMELGFNLDFAPVADIWSNTENTVIGDRAFGTTAEVVSPMTAAMVKGMRESGIMTTLKHFPGHGDTAEDSHNGTAYSYKTLDELWEEEFLPFQAGIEAGTDLVMMAHISLPNVPGGDVPASLSCQMVTEILRGELEFQGLVITDALNMKVITNQYTSGEAAVLAVNAGVDLLLMPEDFHEAFQGVLQAVRDGKITEERLDESVARILEKKLELM